MGSRHFKEDRTHEKICERSTIDQVGISSTNWWKALLQFHIRVCTKTLTDPCFLLKSGVLLTAACCCNRFLVYLRFEWLLKKFLALLSKDSSNCILLWSQRDFTAHLWKGHCEHCEQCSKSAGLSFQKSTAWLRTRFESGFRSSLLHII